MKVRIVKEDLVHTSLVGHKGKYLFYNQLKSGCWRLQASQSQRCCCTKNLAAIVFFGVSRFLGLPVVCMKDTKCYVHL